MIKRLDIKSTLEQKGHISDLVKTIQYEPEVESFFQHNLESAPQYALDQDKKSKQM